MIECIGCGSTRRKLQIVPTTLIDYFFKYKNIIIKCNHKICQICLTYDIYLRLLKIEKFKNTQHSLSTKWIQRLQKQALKDESKISQYKREIAKQREIIQKLKKQHVVNTKFQRIKFNKSTTVYDEELCNVPQVKSSRWTNNIQYQLLANADCWYLAGYTRIDIIKQAKICEWPSELIFQTRFFMKHYPTRKMQAIFFGSSESKLLYWRDKTLDVMEKKYAKPVLINDKPKNEQYWNRDKIKQNTPNFVWKLRGIDRKKEDVIVLNCDSTYQYIDTPQTSHRIRKYTTNIHKGRRLIKIHIWGCTNGLPIFATYHYGDGHHSDGKIFQASLDADHVAMCEKIIEHDINDDDDDDDDDEDDDEEEDDDDDDDDHDDDDDDDDDDDNDHDDNNDNNNVKDISFTNSTICKEMKNLQELINIQDHCICDNGYRIPDPKVKAPAEPPPDDDQDGQVTVVAASYKRSITAVRQTEERVHNIIKRNKFCRTQIKVDDIKRVPKVWNISMGDIVRDNKILMKDDENSAALTERILDMRHCVTNPADLYWTPKQKKKKRESKKNQQKKSGKEEQITKMKITKLKNRNNKKNKSNNKILSHIQIQIQIQIG